MAGPEEGGRSRVWSSLPWHLLFYLLLAYSTFEAVADGPRSASDAVLRIVPAIVLAAWYAYWLLFPGSRAGAGYFAGAGVLWLVMIVIDPAFFLLGLAVVAPFCLRYLRWGVTVIVLAVGVWVWQRYAEDGAVPWSQLSVTVLFITTGLLSAGYLHAIARESRERKRLIEELRATRDELAAAEREAGMLAERHRLAREIHDTLIQGFASIVMLLEAADAGLRSSHPASRHMRQALEAARENLAESRGVVWELRTNSTCVPLPEAIGRLARRFTEQTGVPVETVVTGTARRLSQQQEQALSRVAQEALANAGKHAGAKRVTVTISYLDDVTILDVSDDGVGFDPLAGAAGPAGGIGLGAMRERMEELDGRLAVESARGEGTTVVAEFPVLAEPEAATA